MSLLRNSRLLSLITLIALSAPCAIPLKAQEPKGFYTVYFFYQSTQFPVWQFCGATASTSGCFAAGNLGPFGKAGALIEGDQQAVDANTVSHPIYVVDTEAGTGTDVMLYVYKETIFVDDLAASTVTLEATVSLPLTGGVSAICSMAGNDGYLYIGTDQTAHAVRVRKSDLSVINVGNWGGAKVKAISADKRGYIMITFGVSGYTGTAEFAPNGYSLGYGGPTFVLNTNTAFIPGSFPIE